MENKPFIVNLIGRSGCGKGTQAKLLMEHFGNMHYISSGDLLRDLMKKGTLTGDKVKQIVDSGGLPPDDVVLALIIIEIGYNVKNEESILLDGVARRIEEAKALDGFFNWLGFAKNSYNILVDISRDEAFNRLTKRRICKNCGRLIPWVGEFKNIEACDKCLGELETRPDDTPEAINNRLDYFDEEVMKAIRYYEGNGKLIKVNGEQAIDKVFADILKELEKMSYASK